MGRVGASGGGLKRFSLLKGEISRGRGHCKVLLNVLVLEVLPPADRSGWAGKPTPLTTRSIFDRTSDAFSAGAPPPAPTPRPALLSRPALLLLALRALVLLALALVRLFSVSPFFLQQALPRRPPPYRPTR